MKPLRLCWKTAKAPVNDGVHLTADNYHFFNIRLDNVQPRRKQRGIKRKILNAPGGGELNARPPQTD